jgi:hypothetical protein
MQKVLFAFIGFALHSFLFGSMLQAGETLNEPRTLRYEYKIETDFGAHDFSDVFCDRLKSKHQWHQVESTVSADETYTSVFRFNDSGQHRWECEVRIKRDIKDSRKMDILMMMSPMLES